MAVDQQAEQFVDLCSRGNLESLEAMEAEFVELCYRGDLEGVRAALQSGADVNSKRAGQTGLMTVLKMKHIAVTSLLLEQEGIDVNIFDYIDRTPLHHAAGDDDTSECLAMILAQTSSVNERDVTGWTPLLYAVVCNARRCVQLLLSDERTDPNIKDNVGDSPLMVAVKQNNVYCVELLLADPRVDLMTRDRLKRSRNKVAR